MGILGPDKPRVQLPAAELTFADKGPLRVTGKTVIVVCGGECIREAEGLLEVPNSVEGGEEANFLYFLVLRA